MRNVVYWQWYMVMLGRHSGFESTHKGFEYGERKEEMVLDFTLEYDLFVLIMWYRKACKSFTTRLVVSY